MTNKDTKRFWSFVKTGSRKDCWPFLSADLSSTYGQFYVSGKTRSAHRFAYEITKGKIRKGHVICHKCDNKPCCNPWHLFAGTKRTNSRDFFKKKSLGRHHKYDFVTVSFALSVQDHAKAKATAFLKKKSFRIWLTEIIKKASK